MKKLIVVLLCFCIIGYSLLQLYKLCTTTAPDFTVYYQSTYDVTHHVVPYTDKKLFTAFNYPLITTILFLPLLPLPQLWAQCAFLVLSYVSVFGSVFLTLKILKQKPSVFILLCATAFALFAFPTKFTLGMGQINLISLFFLLFFFWRYQQRKKDYLIWFIFACICKPILLFLLLFFVFRKKWKEIGITLGMLGALGMLCSYAFGLQHASLYYFQHTIPSLLSYAGREVYYNQGISGLVGRLTENLSLREIATDITAAIIVSICSFVFRKKVRDITLFSLLLTLLVILDGLSWQHHFVFLLFPFLFTWFETAHLIKKSFFLGCWVLAYLLVSLNIKQPQSFASFPAVLLLSHVFYGALILLGLQIHLQWRNMCRR